MKTLLFAVSVISASALVAQEAKREPMQGVKRGSPQPTLATLVIGANAAVGNVSEPAWPLIIAATFDSDGQSTAPALPSNLMVKMTNEAGTAIEIPFQPVPPPTAAAQEPQRYWLALESATVSLTPGRHRVTVVSATGATPGWRIAPAEFQVLAPDPRRNGALSLLKMHRAMLLERPDDALAEADRALATHPRDIPLWIAKGDILLKKDDADAALEAYDRALALQRKAGRASYPLLQRRREAHLRALEKRDVIPKAP
jgi:hypothetical protein